MNKKCQCIIIMVCLLFLISPSIYSSSIKEDIELQNRCEKSCEEFFKQKYGNSIIDTKDESGIRNFHNHFNKKLNKCFILIINTGFKKDIDNTSYKWKSLWDINENKQYGSFQYLRMVINCDVLDKKCNSEREWDSVVRPYMEE
jgi:hypothetical protein